MSIAVHAHFKGRCDTMCLIALRYVRIMPYTSYSSLSGDSWNAADRKSYSTLYTAVRDHASYQVSYFINWTLCSLVFCAKNVYHTSCCNSRKLICQAEMYNGEITTSRLMIYNACTAVDMQRKGRFTCSLHVYYMFYSSSSCHRVGAVRSA